MKAAVEQAPIPSAKKLAAKALATPARAGGPGTGTGGDGGPRHRCRQPRRPPWRGGGRGVETADPGGVSLTEAVRCATVNGADLLGLDRGRIAVGSRADFLVARGTPAQLPRKFSYLEAIWLAGRPSPIYQKNPQRSER